MHQGIKIIFATVTLTILNFTISKDSGTLDELTEDIHAGRVHAFLAIPSFDIEVDENDNIISMKEDNSCPDWKDMECAPLRARRPCPQATLIHGGTFKLLGRDCLLCPKSWDVVSCYIRKNMCGINEENTCEWIFGWNRHNDTTTENE